MIPVNEPLLDGNEEKYLSECIRTGWISSDGPFVKEFEERFAAAVGRRYGVAVCNGSVALDVAVLAAGIGPGDEVILPTFTIISCATAILRAGATPVLVDCDPVTWNMRVDQIEEKITPRTKAIMVVHLYGLPAEMDAVLEIAKKNGLKMIEDAAEAHGQAYRGRPCGSFGDLSTFSFYANKHITTGEGGMIVTDDLDMANKCRDLRNLCFRAEKRFVHEEMGFNFRMTNLQAAVGLAQLEKLEEHLALKKRMGKLYTEQLAGISEIQLPLIRTDYAENHYWVYGVVLGDETGWEASDVMSALAARGVGTRPFFWPMHQQPVFQKMGMFAGEVHPTAERLARKGFYLPSGMGLRVEQIQYSAKGLAECVEELKARAR
jgi:perosamine synthetase